MSDAYQDPKGAAPGTMNSVAGATGGGLIGALIGSAVEATQNNMFEGREGEKFAKLKSASPKNISGSVDREVKKAFKGNPFFSSKIKGQSANTVTSKITGYSLARTGKTEGTLLMSPSITADVTITGADGKEIGSGWENVSGISTISQPVAAYIANPSLLKKGYEEAARNLGTNFTGQLAQRTAE